MNWLNWFRLRAPVKSRRHRQAVPRHARFDFEQLEPRLSTSLFWDPGPGIDIRGIFNGNGSIFVAGQTIGLFIDGTGEDWDTWVDGNSCAGMNPPDCVPASGQAQDAVTITWSGASCVSINGGRQASCTLGSAGAPGQFHIVMHADDDGVTPAGDLGNRDDPAVEFDLNITAIWVTISLKSSGSMDPDDTLAGHPWFPGGPRQLGPATSRTVQGVEQPGLWSRVELTGTVDPRVADGTGRFDWRQQSDLRACGLRKDGTVEATGRFTGEDAESPDEQFQTHTTVNSKVFMLDAPGTPAFSGALFEEIIFYESLTTWVNFNNTRASDDFEWYETITLRNDGTDYMFNNPGIVVREGHDFSRPPGTPPVDDGNFPVDCSTQVW